MRFSNLRTRIGAFAVTAVMASCIAVPTAFAQTYYDGTLDNSDVNAIPSTSMSPNSRPTAAAARAAMPAAEILGLQGVEESGQMITLQQVGNYYQPVYSWTAPKYLLFASSYSTQPSPYLVNFAVHANSMAVYNPGRGGTSGNGPNQVLAAYGTDSTDDAVWDMLPDVIIGNGGLSNSSLLALADPDEVADGYSPVGVNYNVSHYPQLIQTVIDICYAAGDSTVAAITDAYVTYIEDAQDTAYTGSIVAWVTDYDSSTGLFTIGSSYTTNGTAAMNRYLETAEWAGATNLNANTNSDSMQVNAATLGTANLIVLGGQQASTGDFWTIAEGLLENDLLNKTYFVKDNDFKRGSAYGLVMNSIENAQNIGRILQPITGLSQRDSLAYYFETFYHINSANLAHVMHQSFDGYLRNWNRTITYTDYYDSVTGAWDTAQAVADLTVWNESTDCGYTPAS